MNKKIQLLDLGNKDYKDTWDYQEELFKEIVDIKVQNRQSNFQLPTPNFLLYVEHPHVYTLGKSGDVSNLLLSEKQLEAKGATFYKINRGGDITYHGPGQIVGYPIFDLDKFHLGLKDYIYKVEEAVILTLAHYGITATRLEHATGVWLDVESATRCRKICAIGVKSSRFVTMHGFALNVNTDLTYFKNINPCGFIDKGVTSIEQELGRKLDLLEVESVLTKFFKQLFC